MNEENSLFKERDLSTHQFQGLVEHSHTILKCSSCRRQLIDVCVVKPDEPFTWHIKAECPFCGDASFASEIKGGFLLGWCEQVRMVDVVTDGDKITVKTIKL